MILLTRWNGNAIYINPELIFTVESTPDTVMTMTNGEKLIVKESTDEVVQRYMTYKKEITSFVDRSSLNT